MGSPDLDQFSSSLPHSLTEANESWERIIYISISVFIYFTFGDGTELDLGDVSEIISFIYLTGHMVCFKCLENVHTPSLSFPLLFHPPPPLNECYSLCLHRMTTLLLLPSSGFYFKWKHLRKTLSHNCIFTFRTLLPDCPHSLLQCPPTGRSTCIAQLSWKAVKRWLIFLFASNLEEMYHLPKVVNKNGPSVTWMAVPWSCRL